MKILIAHDTDSDRIILKTILSKDGYDVITASNGKEAVDLFIKESPDVIMLDSLMPILNGFDACRAIRKDDRSRTVPIMMLTSLTDTESLIKCLESGADDVLQKPYSRNLLKVKIEALYRARNSSNTQVIRNEPVKAPSVFISYSHDNEPHSKWVLKLAEALAENGVIVYVDAWDVGPGDSLPKFMNNAVEKADKILVVCTENYVSKANRGIGGVGYETQILSSTMMENIDENKCIPLIRSNNGQVYIPTFLHGRFYCNFSNDTDFHIELERVLRSVHNSPSKDNLRPPLGLNPFT